MFFLFVVVVVVFCSFVFQLFVVCVLCIHFLQHTLILHNLLKIPSIGKSALVFWNCEIFSDQTSQTDFCIIFGSVHALNVESDRVFATLFTIFFLWLTDKIEPLPLSPIKFVSAKDQSARLFPFFCLINKVIYIKCLMFYAIINYQLKTSKIKKI